MSYFCLIVIWYWILAADKTSLNRFNKMSQNTEDFTSVVNLKKWEDLPIQDEADVSSRC